MTGTTEARQDRTLRDDIYLAISVYLIASVVFLLGFLIVSPL